MRPKMTHETYLSVSDLAALCGVTRQAAHRAAVMASRKQPWRGMQLAVREVEGSRGGRSGVRYEVALSSLSEAYQNVFNGDDGNEFPTSRALTVTSTNPTPKQLARTPQGAKIMARYEAIAPALAHPPRSAERAAALLAAVRPGRKLRTLQRWVEKHEEGDLSSLGHARPSNAGERRVWVSRVFDKAYRQRGYEEAGLREWGARRDQLIKDVWASPAQRAGWKRVRLEVKTFLQRESAAAGVDLPANAFALSQRAIVEVSHYREVDIYAHDRKTWDDRKPRIRRDRSMWKPMEEVVLDVHHIDVVLTRPDGREMYPKMVAFLDSGTSRMFLHFVFPPKGEAVRQEHVLTAFLAMVEHPDWGLPQRIYMDNGSENLRLIEVGALLDMVNQAGLKTIVKARPYSGASKPIESKFALMIQHVFSQMEGYVGSDRTNKKSERLGRKTRPYHGSYEEFAEEVRSRLLDLEDQLIGSGVLAGRSPRQVFEDHVRAGTFKRITVDPLALDSTFATITTAKVDRGMLRIRGGVYRHPDLPTGRVVTIALSFRRGAAPLAKVPGGDWVYLQEDMPFAPWADDGAIEAKRIQSRARKSVGDLRAGTSRPDLAANVLHRVGRQPVKLATAAAPAPLMDAMASSQAIEMAAARLEGENLRLMQPSEDERRRKRRMEETEELERYIASKRA